MSPIYSSIPGYLLALYIVIPLVVLCLALLVMFLCCSKRYRLNWFERSLLQHDDEEIRRINKPSPVYSNTSSPRLSIASIRRGSQQKYGPLLTPNIFAYGNMGSNPSTPQNTDGESEQGSEQFWVPPDVVRKKRAQSLVATLMHNDTSDEESTPTSNTPIMSTSLQELSYTLPTDKLAETLQSVQMPANFNRQRRRASMHDAIDHTKINTRLYDKVMMPVRQTSIGSIQEENMGSINFSLDYNKETALMTVRIIQAHDLVPRDLSGTANPYCQICMLPNRKMVVQTKVQKKSLNPEFEEEFIFEILPQDISNTIMEILIYDFDPFSRDECLGQIHLILETIDLTDKVTLWKGFSPYEKDKSVTECGDVMFSLGYLSSAKRLTVVIMKARNIRAVDKEKGTSDPFAKVALIFGGKRLKKKKTTTLRGTQNPVWNEALVFNLGSESLTNLQIEISVIHEGLLGNNEVLGYVVVGPYSSGNEHQHWNDMVQSKNATARWHHLCD
ncbi:synaptotagmin-5-like [Tubulanus polymorphus]|uniref:synaptotagmin-5-like n=1 Tax=Tubulanus polymorphus TaxID=672921 RepID=UPI003DA3D440